MTIAIDINDVIRDNMFQFRNIYQKYVDNSFELDLDDVDSFDMMHVYPFNNEEELFQFKYVDYAFEIFARAECCDKMLPYAFNDWIEKALRNLDEENVPDVVLFSPFEIGLSIQSTYSFLAAKSLRARGILFPKDSSTIYDKADVVITAQPSLIENCPEGKYVIKVNKPYNKDCEAKYAFDSMLNIINDPNDTIIKILENRIDG